MFNMREQMRMRQEIICAVWWEEILLQCAEECSELAVACSKVRRTHFGTTQLKPKEACDTLTEKAGDVILLLNCLDQCGILDLEAARESAQKKNIRWYGRTTGK